jgi:uncharacterized protein
LKSGDLTLSLDQARRLAVRGQHLAGPRPASGLNGMRQVLRGLRVLQVDPINEFRRHVLDLLAASGPLPGEAIEDRAAVGWVSTGWTHGRNVELRRILSVGESAGRSRRAQAR